jgi:hypothetical protein
MRRRLVLIPVLAAMIATGLFVAQGGFGGGHGDLDRMIWVLGFPGMVLAGWAPASLASHDLLLLVWWPALWNVLLWAAIASVISRFRRGTSGQ